MIVLTFIMVNRSRICQLLILYVHRVAKNRAIRQMLPTISQGRVTTRACSVRQDLVNIISEGNDYLLHTFRPVLHDEC